MSSISGLVLKAEALGATFRIDGETLKVSAAKPLPTDLMAQLRQNRDQITKLYSAKPRLELCHTCTCDLYIVRLQGDCPACQGHLCAKCGGCLKSSHAWRHQKIEPIQVGDPLEVILDSLRKGQKWLRVQHNALYDNPGSVDLDKYTRGLDRWDGLEVTLRQIHGFQGCIFGEGKHCPEDSQPVCKTCASS